MRIVVGADHAGYELKEALKGTIQKMGHVVVDVGTDSTRAVDYPDYAQAVGEALRDGRADRGILICGSGVGASIAANKMPGIRAAVCHDLYSAHQGVEHDDMNVLTLGARVIDLELARGLVENYLGATFSGDDRHVRRLNKVLELESKYCHE